MKKCTGCKERLSLSEFSNKASCRDGYSSRCKACVRNASKKHYYKNKQRYLERNKRYQPEFRGRRRAKLVEYFAKHPCVDCGNSNPIVLEFDHIDRSKKKEAVSQMISNGSPWNDVLKEIEKCQVRCANCHRIKTSMELGWYKYEAR